MIFRVLAILLLGLIGPAAAVTDTFNINVTIGAQTPGPSLLLYNTNGTGSSPYYTCTVNLFVTASATGTGTGTAASPWNLNQALNYAPTGTGGSWCVNFATGTYNTSLVSNPAADAINITHGGNAATTLGYLVWRCQSMPFSFSNGVIQGEGQGCVFSDNIKQFGVVGVQAPYFILDGFEIAGNVPRNSSEGGVLPGVCFDNEFGHGSANASKWHHVWLMNSDLHDCTQSGIQWWAQDWVFIIHNIWHDTAGGGGASSNGSGYSNYEPTGLQSYSPTAQDQLFKSSTTGRQYSIITLYNVGYNSNNQNLSGTDGEGIIYDDWGNNQTACPSGGACPYPGHGLIMGNVMYANGANGIEAFAQVGATGFIDIVNNTVYANNTNTQLGSVWGAGLLSNLDTHVFWINNVSYSTSTVHQCPQNQSGATSPACTVLVGQSTALTSVVMQNNFAFPANSLHLDGTNDQNSYPLVGTNKNFSGTDPKLTTLSVTNPNFALQSGSPAIAAGQAFDLWQQSGTIDSGACPFSSPGPVASCP